MADPHREEIAKLEALHAANPDGRIFTHLAEAYRKAGDLERARKTVEQGLSRHSNYPSAHVVLGRILWDMGDVVAAEAAFRRVLELDPENRVALRSLGDLARDSGRPGEALERYRALLLLDPGDAEVQELARSAEEQMSVIGEALDLTPGSGPAESNVEPMAADDFAPAVEPVDVGGLDGLEPTVISGGDEVEGIDLVPVDLDLDTIGAEPGGGDFDPVAIEGLELAGDAEVEGGLDLGIDWTGADGGLEADGGIDDVDLDRPVVTETMADLYARQGLHDRAAEVYRELLRGRPGDARLEAKLREAEGKALGGEAPVEDEGDIAAPGLEEAWLTPAEMDAPVDLEPVAGEMPGGEWTGGGAEFGEAEFGAADEVVGIEEIGVGDRLAVADDFGVAPETAAGDAIGVADDLAAGDEFGVGDGTAGLDALATIDETAAAAEIPAVEEAAASPWSDIVGAAELTIGEYLRALLVFRGAGEAGLDAAAGGPPTGDAAAPSADQEGPAGDAGVLMLDETAIVEDTPYEPDEYDRLFDSPSSASSEGVADLPGVEPFGPGATPPASDAVTPGGASSSGSAGTSSAGDDDDEDLEMFRAWLQNLKR